MSRACGPSGRILQHGYASTVHSEHAPPIRAAACLPEAVDDQTARVPLIHELPREKILLGSYARGRGSPAGSRPSKLVANPCGPSRPLDAAVGRQQWGGGVGIPRRRRVAETARPGAIHERNPGRQVLRITVMFPGQGANSLETDVLLEHEMDSLETKSILQQRSAQGWRNPSWPSGRVQMVNPQRSTPAHLPPELLTSYTAAGRS